MRVSRLDGRGNPSRIAELPDRFRFFPVLRSVYSTSLHRMARPVFLLDKHLEVFKQLRQRLCVETDCATSR